MSDLRSVLQEAGERLEPDTTLPSRVRTRVRRRQATTALAAAIVLSAVGVGSAAGIHALSDRAARVPAIQVTLPPAPAPSGPVTCVSGWHVQPMPVVQGDYVDELVAMSAVATDDIWAAGVRFVTQHTNDEPTQALFEHWDGRQWTIVPSPDVGSDGAWLSAIDMTSPTDGWAVGRYAPVAPPSKGPLVEHWDGTRWSVVTGLPHVPGEPADAPLALFAVRAFSSTDVWVVGHYSPVESGESVSRDVFEHWDGHAWAVAPWPVFVTHGGGVVSRAIQGMSGRSSRDLWAAGGYLQGSGESGAAAGAVIEHWNGVSWSRVAPPDGPAPLTGLAEVSPNELWGLRGGDFNVAFGGYGGFSPPQILHWDGQSWSVSLELPAHGPSLNAIVAVDHRDAWAVGVRSGQPLIEHWNGKSWSVPPNANGHLPELSVFAHSPSVDTTEHGDVIVFSNEALQASPQNRLWFRCGGGA